MSELSMVISFSLKGKRRIDTDGWYQLATHFTLWAHNSEVTRSKRVVSIFYTIFYMNMHLFLYIFINNHVYKNFITIHIKYYISKYT